MRILATLLLLSTIGFASCKKENNAPPPPALDSNFLKFTSSVPYNGTLNYVAILQGSTLSKLELASQYLAVEAGVGEFDVATGFLYAATLSFENLRHTLSVQEVAINIPFTETTTSTSRTQKANLTLSFPNRDIWTSTGGTAHISRLGGGTIQGYFDATFTNAQQSGKTIQLTNGTFNMKYKF